MISIEENIIIDLEKNGKLWNEQRHKYINYKILKYFKQKLSIQHITDLNMLSDVTTIP